MIGKAYKVRTPYYDRIEKREKFKSRPCLIIGQADSGDYVILPISSVTDKSKIDPNYDLQLPHEKFPFLHKDSYLRTHKQLIANIAALKGPIGDLKTDFPDTYHEALRKVEAFQQKLIQTARQ